MLKSSEGRSHARPKLRKHPNPGITQILKTPFGHAIFWSRKIEAIRDEPGGNGFRSGFDAAITQFLEIDGVPLKLTATFSRSVFDDFTSQSHPVVAISKRLPSDSRIFRKILRGDLDGIKRLAKAKQFDVSDCDSEGRSLLNVSTVIRMHRSETLQAI